jgi:hypothetical protein
MALNICGHNDVGPVNDREITAGGNFSRCDLSFNLVLGEEGGTIFKLKKLREGD